MAVLAKLGPMLAWLFSFASNHLNLFAVPSYEVSTTRDNYAQLVLSVVAFASSATLVGTALAALSVQPIVTPVSVSNPSPTQMLDLFRRFGAEEITALSCPCSTQFEVLSAVSNWTVTEDSYCAALRGAVADPKNSGLSDLLRAPGNEECIGSQSDPEFQRFVKNLQELGEKGNFWPERDQSLTLALNFMQESVCGLAFGLVPPSRYYPLGSPSEATIMRNFCGGLTREDSLSEEELLAPNVFAYSASPVNAMQSQHSRSFTFFSESASLCQTLAAIRGGFLRDVQDVRLALPLALSPFDLGAAVESSFFTKLGAISGSLAAFIPGLTPDRGLSAATDAFNPLFELNFKPPRWNWNNSQNLFPDAVEPPQLYTSSTFPFSSRLPFVRTDYIEGGTSRFYLIVDYFSGGSQFGTSSLFPVASGLARLRVATNDSDSFPFPGTNNSRRITRGFIPGKTKGWAPVGDDFLTLLDACESGAALTVDIHNFRALSILGKYNDESLWGCPIGTVCLFQDNMNLGFNTCPLGDPPVSDGAQPVLFNVSVRCPPLLTWLGRLRRGSSFYSRNSSSRFSIREYISASPAARAKLVTNLEAGDTLERLDLLSSLSIDASSPVFSHDPLRHYAACAPAFCAYTIVEQRTLSLLALDAVSVYGGTATTVITVLGVFASLIAVLGRQVDAAMMQKSRKVPPPPQVLVVDWASINGKRDRG